MPRILETGLKLCSRCGQYKLGDAFNKMASAPDGLQYWCRECQNTRARKRYQTDDAYREELNRSRRELWRSDPDFREKLREANHRVYARNRRDPKWVEKERVRQQVATREYPERVRAKSQKQQARKESDPEYRAYQNRRHRDYMRERYANDPGFKSRLRDYFARRRAVRRGNGGSYDLEDWQEMCAFAKGRCLACGKERGLTVDHVLPVIMGGSSYLTNLQPLCGSCNKSKGVQFIDYRPPAMLQWLDLATD